MRVTTIFFLLWIQTPLYYKHNFPYLQLKVNTVKIQLYSPMLVHVPNMQLKVNSVWA